MLSSATSERTARSTVAAQLVEDEERLGSDIDDGLTSFPGKPECHIRPL